MSFTGLLDVSLGLTLIYLASSLFVTIINEFIGQIWKLRAKQLAKNLKQLIDDEGAVEILCANPALASFFKNSRSPSAYVDTKILAEQLIGGLRKGAQSAATMKDIIDSINSMNESTLKNQLLALTQVATDNVETLVKNTSALFDQSLTMMGEVYKKHMQIISFSIGLVIAVSLNVDTLSLATNLYRDADARNAIAGIAVGLVEEVDKEKFARCSKLDTSAIRKDNTCTGLVNLIDGLRQHNDTFGQLPIGWSERTKVEGSIGAYALALIGWLLTALAISLGASFWFDLLSRLVNIRHAMRKPPAA